MTTTPSDLLIVSLDPAADGRLDAAGSGARDAVAMGVGGFLLSGGEQDAVRAFAKEMQQRARTTLLIGAELERGAGQRFAGATGLPPLAAVASLGDPEALRRAARLTAREARTIGVNWNLAPVLDLDPAGDGGGLGTRSLGNDPASVARLAAEWITTCQAEGVLACAKHFPGAGRVPDDGAPGAAPAVRADRDALHAADLVPFRTAIDAGVASMLTSHAAYPALDPGGAPAALSRELIQWLLRQQMRFDGLIVADLAALSSAGAGEDELAVRAIAAGCDVLLNATDVAAVAAALGAALAERRLDPERVRQSQRRRLKWAQWAAPPNDWRRPTASDAAWGAQLADRVVRAERGEPAPLRGGSDVDVVVVNDDAAPRAGVGEPLVETLRTAGVRARLGGDAEAGHGGPLLVALFGEARAGYGAATRERVAALADAADRAGRPVTVLQFGHPRGLAGVAPSAAVVTAWAGDRAMQQAAARWLTARAARAARG